MRNWLHLLSSPSLKVLLVVAHPDDESECAASIYRITHEFGGVVDQVVVTNGEAGHRFSEPALAWYGLAAGDVAKELPRLRRLELLRAGRILGIRNHYFLGQKDTGFTLDPSEGQRAWDLPFVRRELRRILNLEQYDLVLTLLPEAGTHGHHQTVALLALETVEQMPLEKRPSVAGVRTGSDSTPEFDELPGFPATRAAATQPVWSFDRRTPLRLNAALDHSVIVHWVIAEHKSQGMFQMEYGRHTHEYFWQFAVGRERPSHQWRGLFEQPVRQHVAGQLVAAEAI